MAATAIILASPSGLAEAVVVEVVGNLTAPLGRVAMAEWAPVVVAVVGWRMDFFPGQAGAAETGWSSLFNVKFYGTNRQATDDPNPRSSPHRA
jgi:hypothetical protein